MSESAKKQEEIYKLIREKSSMKQDVFDVTKKHFSDFKTVLEEMILQMSAAFKDDDRLDFYYKDKGDFEAEVKVAGDVLVFSMHTNIFLFEKSNSLWRSSYLKENEHRAFVGTITVYNFLADSIKYQRSSDLGYLIARIFINAESHFMVQGKQQLGFLFNDFISAVLEKQDVKKIIDSIVHYTLNFDLFIPPFHNIQQVSVQQIQALSQHLSIATGKRLGFRFDFEDDME